MLPLAVICYMVTQRNPRKKRSKVWTVPVEQLREDILKATSLSQVLKKYDLPTIGGTPAVLKERLKLEKIDFSHIKLGLASNLNRKFDRGLSREESLALVFVKDSTYSVRSVRDYFLKFEFVPYVCKECGQKPWWNGKPLSLQLDHVNGDTKNQSLGNLRWLCPHCHTQTETFGSKKRLTAKKELI